MRALAFILLFLAAASAASAGSLRVSPVLFELTPARGAATLTLHNEGEQPMTVQLRVYRWSNGPNGDVLTPATDLAASPPFASVQGGTEQTVRLVRTGAAAPLTEQAYRVLVDELPSPDRAEGRTVTLLMRHSIPIFIEAGTAHTDVHWTARLENRAYRLAALNSGGRRQRVAEVRLYDAAGHVLAQQKGLLGYVLAGSTAAWSLPAAPDAALAPPAKLSFDTDQGHLDVAVSPPTP